MWTSFIKWLLSLFNKPVVPPIIPPVIKYIPISKLPIEYGELYNLLHTAYPQAAIFLSDSVAILCHPDDIAYFLAEYESSKPPYIAEYYDCDDYAVHMVGEFSIPDWAGLCIGELWTTTHAFNIIINEQKQILFIEPQTNEISTHLFGTGTNVVLIKI